MLKDTRLRVQGLQWLFATMTFVLMVLLLTSEDPDAVPPSTAAPSRPPSAIPASDDYHRLMDLSDFRFTQRATCSSAAAPLVVVVHSAPNNGVLREAIRTTWGGEGGGVPVFFMVGAVGDEGHQRRLEAEGRLRGDLVQGNFVDSYRNLTYKHTMALKWARYHCPGARYVLKTDDDIFVNMPNLLRLVDNGTFPEKNLILCDVIKNAGVKRSWRSKWHVSPREYLGRYYPTYCPGWIVMYSRDVAQKLYESTQLETYFWVDDVLITGVVAQKVRARHFDISPWRLSLRTAKRMLQNTTQPSPRMVFGPWELEPEEITELWALVQKQPSAKITSKKLLD